MRATVTETAGRVRHRCQIDVPHIATKSAVQSGRGFDGKPRLAGTPGAGQRHQTVVGHLLTVVPSSRLGAQ